MVADEPPQPRPDHRCGTIKPDLLPDDLQQTDEHRLMFARRSVI
jgi:hypothetical protein